MVTGDEVDNRGRLHTFLRDDLWHYLHSIFRLYQLEHGHLLIAVLVGRSKGLRGLVEVGIYDRARYT